MVALAGAGFVAVQMWWVSQVRRLGSFNVDEAGGIAAALRFHRSLEPTTLRPLLRAIFHTWNGPVVPLLSVPALIPGERTSSWVILIQPVLVAVAALGAAGIVRHLVGPRPALVAGAVVLCMPISVISSRSYQYSTGVGAFLALAVWALVTSDRGRKRWHLVGFGAATAAMVLSRTMSIAFVPFLALAVVLVIARERRALMNVGLAALTWFVLAGIWLIDNFAQISEYLYVNAFGERARYWGAVPLDERLLSRFGYFMADYRLLVAPGLAALVLAAIARWRAPAVPGLRSRAAWWAANRELVAVWVVAIGVFLALFSTSNFGYWFAYPQDVVVVAAVVATAVRLARDGRQASPRWLGALGLCAVAIAALSLLLSLVPNGSVGSQGYGPSWQRLFVTTHNQMQGGNNEADRRFESDDPAERRQAAKEWFDANAAVASTIDRLQREHGTVVQSIIGEIHLLNANTIGLTEEVTNQGIAGIEVVNTLEPPDEVLRQTLSPWRGKDARVMVLIISPSLGFPDGRGWPRYLDLAIDEGWRAQERIPLPAGGEVLIFTHPASIPSG